VTEKRKKKYIFVRGSNPSVVWDPAANKPLAEFCDPESKKVSGFFTTTDEKVADRLREMGYKERKDFPEGAPKGGFKPLEHEPDLSAPGSPFPKKKPDILEEEYEEEDEEEVETKEPKRSSIRRRK